MVVLVASFQVLVEEVVEIAGCFSVKIVSRKLVGCVNCKQSQVSHDRNLVR